MLSHRAAVGGGLLTVAAWMLLGLAGCGPAGPKTYPVEGKVEMVDGNVDALAGHYVEFQRESDPPVAVSGEIQPDGSFVVKMLHQGQVLTGAPEGTYRARIVLLEEDDGEETPRRPPVHPRFLDYETSGLSFTVPTQGNITVQVAQR